ncbi:MAG: hypothetical protein GY850_34220 [bacterium]|nr:hypothetical protein [bacterium]
MDKVTQQNAANAEESASAAEEMNAQAEQMKGFVDHLVELVGGKGKSADVFKPAERVRAPKAIAVSAKKASTREIAIHRSNEVNPELVIPLDDDFNDF